MKKYFLFSLMLLLVSGLSAQKKSYSNAEKKAPIVAQIDTQAPVVTCLNGLTTNLFQSGQTTLWASDVLQSVTDNETPTAQIKIGIRLSGTGTGFPVDGNGNPLESVLLDCGHLGVLGVELWAIDLAGNAAYCETPVEVVDVLGYCNQLYDTVQVCVTYGCDGSPMPGVPLDLSGEINFFPPPLVESDSVSGLDGCATQYLFYSSFPYTISAHKDDNPLNGVTTFDLLLIANHILGLEPLDNPYKLIAADINKSGSITTFDLIELRKLILGIYSELPNNTSWRFVPEDFEFPNPANPFAIGFPEYLTIENGQIENTGLTGIKVGDVDCTAQFNNAPPPDYPDVFLNMPDTFLQAGQVYDLPIGMAVTGTWQGYQFGIDFDAQKLKFQGIVYHPMTSSANWNTNQIQDGRLATSWFSPSDPVVFGPNDPIATIRFLALGDFALSSAIGLSAGSIHPEGYAGQNADKKDLLLAFVPQFKPKNQYGGAEKNAPTFEPAPNADVTPPVVTCLNGLSANLMPTGFIQLWASDFLSSVSDNKTPVDQIKIAIRKLGTGFGFPVDAQGNPVQSVLFDCNEIGTQSIELWAKDATGNAAHCETYVLVQDNLNNCNNQSGDWVIEICATTEASDGIEECSFEIIGQNPNGPFYGNEVPGPNDACAYYDVPLGSNVTVWPVKDDNPLNGVTTYDLVLISRHIRGIEPLNTPFKIIAADANHDNQVTLEDSIVIRELILGIITAFPNNTSWRFVDKSYVFPDPSNPFAAVFPEVLSVNNIQAAVSADFVGIKVGDVNNSAINNLKEVDERSVDEAFNVGLPYPNPTFGNTKLPLRMPHADNLRIEVSDLSGKLVWADEVSLEKGSFELEIPASAFPQRGIYVWRLLSGEMARTGKLLRL